MPKFKLNGKPSETVTLPLNANAQPNMHGALQSANVSLLHQPVNHFTLDHDTTPSSGLSQVTVGDWARGPDCDTEVKCRVTTRAQANAAQQSLDDTCQSSSSQSIALPVSNATQSTPKRTRKQKGPANLLQFTAPMAAANIASNDFWSREYIISQQNADSVLSHVKCWLTQGKRPDFDQIPSDPAVKTYFQLFDSLTIIDDVLYKSFYDMRGNITFYQLLITHTMRKDLLELCHANDLCHAQTLHKNEQSVQRRAYWPQWRTSVKIFVKSCRRCAEYHRGAPPKQAFLHPSGPYVGAPGERLSIDLTGKHPSSNQFVYCLTTEDCFSKFITLTPLRDKSAATVAKHCSIQSI